MSFGFSDALEVGRLAFRLYQKIQVARKAPEDFRKLANDLVLFQDVIYNLRDYVGTHQPLEPRQGDEDRKKIKRVMHATHCTLKELENFIESFVSLGSRDGNKIRERITWAAKKDEIDQYRAKIWVHTCSLSYWTSSIGNAKLQNIEARLEAVLEQHSKLRKATVAVSTPQFLGPAIQEERHFSEQFSSAILCEGSEEPPTSAAMDRQQSLSSRSATSTFHTDNLTSVSTVPTSPSIGFSDSTTAYPIAHSARHPRPSDASQHSKFSVSEPEHTRTRTPDEDSGIFRSSLKSMIEEAQQLYTEPKEEIQTNPVTLSKIDPPEDYKNVALTAAFEENAKTLPAGPCGRATSANDWLRAATWWYCKFTTINSLNSPRRANESIISSNVSYLSRRQAEVDLRKAAWILYDVVLTDAEKTSRLTDSECKQIYTLDSAIKDALDDLPLTEGNDPKLGRLNLKIWEDLQPTEQQLAAVMGDFRPTHLDPRRWITVREKDAGNEDEGVLFRAFVNAEIGPKDVCLETKGAPYMLLLWTKYGESEAKITLCNQSGSLDLCRDFCRDDLRQSAENTSDESPVTIPMEFHGMTVSIGFLTKSDYEKFLATPRRFFQAVQDRNQRSENEILLYKTVLDKYEPLNPNNARGLIDSDPLRSCELRLYETAGDEGWQITRRLVISSGVVEANPRCISYFLPISFVYVNKEESSSEMKVKWSDCRHRKIKSDGKFNKLYTYAYMEDEQNQCVALSFNSSEDANEFRSTILTLSKTTQKLHHWDPSASCESHSVYNLTDKSGSDSAPSNYRTVVVTNRRNAWHYSNIFHVPRVIDFNLHDNGHAITFNRAYRTHYLSNHRDRYADADPESPPEFVGFRKKLKPEELRYECLQPDCQELMKSITGWKLRCALSPVKISYKNSSASVFRRNVERKENAEVSLWERWKNESVEKRLVIRWEQEVENQWLTASECFRYRHLEQEQRCSISTTNLKGCIDTKGIKRGIALDVIDMEAVSKPKPGNLQKKKSTGGALTIEFLNFENKQLFAKQSDLRFS